MPNRFDILFYCPDHHIRYDLRTLERVGVGGGITARVRVAHSLAARGHRVRLYVNCPREGRIGGVEYRHYSQLNRAETDIFVFGSSGADLDLASLADLDIRARLRLLMVHGVNRPNGLQESQVDFIYALSNFVRDIIVREWSIDATRIFVTHRGVSGKAPPLRRLLSRNPYKLVYAGHPSKGLEAALDIHRSLYEREPRFELHIFGGTGLWGEGDSTRVRTPGVVDDGLVGQKELRRRLQTCSFSLNLQERQEPFGMAVIEAMRAGCAVLASPVGAYPELIRHGLDGFLVPGDPSEPGTRLAAAQLIAELLQSPERLARLRQEASTRPLTWETVARTWEGHWDWLLGGRQPQALPSGACPACGGSRLALADGLHCTGCGRYEWTGATGGSEG